MMDSRIYTLADARDMLVRAFGKTQFEPDNRASVYLAANDTAPLATIYRHGDEVFTDLGVRAQLNPFQLKALAAYANALEPSPFAKLGAAVFRREAA